jgi:2-iminobutanoate/2-iminopropanoate deaminase
VIYESLPVADGFAKAVKRLESAGSSLDRVVMAGVYTSNAGFYPTINKGLRPLLPWEPPSRTFVPVGSSDAKAHI